MPDCSWNFVSYGLKSLHIFFADPEELSQVKPDFNIYEASMPYAVQRALSPQTEAAVAALRETWVTDTGSGGLRLGFGVQVLRFRVWCLRVRV